MTKNNKQLSKAQEQRLYKLHEEKHIGAFDEYKSCENVVVFGNPGCGRSTVIHSILGHELKSIPHPDWVGYFLIDLAYPHNEPQLKISHDFQAGQETLTSIKARDLTIWECTGLYKRSGYAKGQEAIEPQEEEMKMKESPRVMQLLKTVNSVKFILVANHKDLTVGGGCRGEDFIATVDRIASIFSDLDIIKESMLLVITTAPSFATQEGVVDMIKDAIASRDMSGHTKKLMEYLTELPIHIFYQPEKEGKVDGPTLELIQILPSCDVSQSIQYPSLSPLNQELALKTLAEDEARIQQEEETRIQDEEAKKQLEKAAIDTKNISNAWCFTKVVDFLHDTLSSMSILNKAGHYAGEILMAFSSLIGINKFKDYFSSNKMQAVSAEDYSPQPMSPEKAKLAKCLVKILNENEAISQEFNLKFTECKNDEEKQNIIKEFSERIISETNLRNDMSILGKASQYASEILMAFSSLFKGYFSSNKMEAVSEDNDLKTTPPEGEVDAEADNLAGVTETEDKSEI